MGITTSCSCSAITGNSPIVFPGNNNCVRRLQSIRQNLIFPNEILEKVMSFLSLGDKLVAREVCTDWCNHINGAGNLQDSVKIKVSSDELSHLAAVTSPVFTSFFFHKVDITRQSLAFWNIYSDFITHLEFYDCSIIPRNTSDSSQTTFFLGCPNLKYLGLVNCDKYFLMGGAFIQIHEILHLDKLETLNLSQNKNLSDSILFSILLKTKKLQSIDLSDCVNMVFMKAVHNRFYPAVTGNERPPYSDHILSFHTLCMDFLQTDRASAMSCFNFGMRLNSTGMALVLTNDKIKWKLANLESPELKNSDIIQFISKFNTSLEKIQLGHCKLTSEEIFDTNLFSLKTISMYDSRNMKSLQFLMTMPNLRTLVLDGASGFALNSEYFQHIHNLTELSLNGIKPTDSPAACRSELLKIIAILRKLTSLNIGNCSHILDNSVTLGIVRYHRNLKSLNLEAAAISDIGFVTFRDPNAEIPKHFENPDILPETQLCLSQLSDLEHLNLSRCRGLSELTWQIAIRFPNLVTLNLSNCSTLTKRGILSIIENCRNLEKLTLIHCSSQVLNDPEVVAAVREKLYRCSGIIY